VKNCALIWVRAEGKDRRERQQEDLQQEKKDDTFEEKSWRSCLA
jgi:hypothetical protein